MSYLSACKYYVFSGLVKNNLREMVGLKTAFRKEKTVKILRI